MFVDDDTALLNSLDRNLCFDYDLTTAESGQEALERIANEDPFRVIMTDMRMPGMDGVQFIEAARKVAPDTIYLMLTGNQDLDTAIRAVNSGNVFRFLNKPCETDEIQRSIDAALRQYELVDAEKELLHKTFVGAVSAVTNVLEKVRPDLTGVGFGVSSVVQDVCESTGIEVRWEYKLAARIAPLGFAIVDMPQLCSATDSFNPVKKYQQAYQEAAREASDLICKIPRLESVAEIIRTYPDANGSFCHLKPKTNKAIVQVGASLLRIAVQTQLALSHGVFGADLPKELRDAMPDIHNDACDATKNLKLQGELEGVQVPLNELLPGMVLRSDAVSLEGAVLLRAGKRLNTANIDRLREYAVDERPIVITTTSYEAFSEVCV
jgi:CheY-like chemotaxis protein